MLDVPTDPARKLGASLPDDGPVLILNLLLPAPLDCNTGI